MFFSFLSPPISSERGRKRRKPIFLFFFLGEKIKIPLISSPPFGKGGLRRGRKFFSLQEL